MLIIERQREKGAAIIKTHKQMLIRAHVLGTKCVYICMRAPGTQHQTECQPNVSKTWTQFIPQEGATNKT